MLGVGGGVLHLDTKGLGVGDVWKSMSDVLKARVLVRRGSNLRTDLTISSSLPNVETSLIVGDWPGTWVLDGLGLRSKDRLILRTFVAMSSTSLAGYFAL